MCDNDGEIEGFRASSWRRARIARSCYACHETISPGDLYHREAGRADVAFFCYAHCARCWEMLQFLATRNVASVPYDLNCGETYEYAGYEDDPAHALAFLLPEEAETWAKSKAGLRLGSGLDINRPLVHDQPHARFPGKP